MENAPNNPSGASGLRLRGFRRMVENLYDFLPHDDVFSISTGGAGDESEFKVAGIYGASRCRIQGAASANDHARSSREHPNMGSVELGVGRYKLDMISYIELLPTAGAFTDTFVGLFAAKNGPELDDAICFFYDESHSNWQCLTRSSSTDTITDSAIVLANATKYDLRIEINAAGNKVEFFINNALVATHTTNITSVFLTIGHYVRTTTTHAIAGDVSHVIDALYERQKFTVSR